MSFTCAERLVEPLDVVADHGRSRVPFGLTFASLQISSATCDVTREKSSIRTCFTFFFGESCSMWSSIPSSTPCGCGLISCGSRGSS
jgi:hypothetical protein